MYVRSDNRGIGFGGELPCQLNLNPGNECYKPLGVVNGEDLELLCDIGYSVDIP